MPWRFTAASILALGIGASVALFSTVQSVLLRPPAFAAPEDLAILWERDLKRGAGEAEISWSRFEAFQHSGALAAVASISSVNLDFALLDAGDPLQVEGAQVSFNFFEVLGVRPLLGRTFVAADQTGSADAPFPVIISHRLWVDRFGGRDDVLSRPIRISAAKCQVVGVMPSTFAFPRAVDLWIPQTAGLATAQNRDIRVLKLLARRKRGMAWTEAETALNLVIRRMEETASTKGFVAHAVPIHNAIYGNARGVLWTLFAASLLLLLTACANVANLFMARLAARRRELAVRTALGATRLDLASMLLREALLIALAGGPIGVLLAAWATRLLASFGPADVPGLAETTVELPALLFAFALVLITTLLFGLAPVWAGSRVDPARTIRECGERGSGRSARLSDFLIAGEVAITLMLLIGCALAGRSLWNLANIDPGFRTHNVFTFRVTLAGQKFGPQDARKQFYRELLERLRALPGVESAGAVLIRPLAGPVGWDSPFTMEGQTSEEQTRNPYANYEAISPGYFGTMGMPLLAGRDFHGADTNGVVIINEATARRYFGAVDAVGKHVKLGSGPWLEVVGVVKDAHYREWEAARVDLYVPFEQRAQHRSDFVVRTTGNPEAIAESVRREVLRLNPEQPISSVTTIEKLVDGALARPKFLSLVLNLFGAVAAILAMTGLYAVLRFVFASREKELAIRAAIGAAPGDLLRLVLAHGLKRTIAGVVAGLAGGLAVTRWIEPLLFDVPAYSVAAWSAAVGVLFVIAALAALGPARRAARIDPARVLHD
jgi:predicted permease